MYYFNGPGRGLLLGEMVGQPLPKALGFGRASSRWPRWGMQSSSVTSNLFYPVLFAFEKEAQWVVCSSTSPEDEQSPIHSIQKRPFGHSLS